MTAQASQLKGPAVFLAQGFGKKNWTSLAECAATAASLGYKGLQAHLWNGGPIDLELAAGSEAYCDGKQAEATKAGCPIVELANHCDWQLVRCAPCYLKLHQWPAPKHLHGNHVALSEWGANRAKLSVAAAHNFGFKKVGGFSGTSIFHLVYPWPQRPAGLVAAAFNALAAAWLPIFDYADKLGVDVCFELHPGEDLMDGNTFNMFLRYIKNHPRCNILLDLSHKVLAGMTNRHMLGFINTNAARIKMFHVKDGEFNPTDGGGVYDGYQDWGKRAGRFRSTGDGQIDYASVFTLLQSLGLDLWATLEWEDCAGKGWAQGVREGAQYIKAWMDGTNPPARTEPEKTDDGAFDDFAKSTVDTELIAEIIGIPVSQVNTVAA